ncbi:MAG: hypothetical protein ACJA2O_003254 [Candidatus Azotimanducaceae bacterium]|jgi:uncharacterized protein YbaP (TraB family)
MTKWHGQARSLSVVSINLSRIFCLSIFLLLSCASDQKRITDIQPAALSLWQIDHEDAQVYLLGSVHALKPEHYPLPISIEEAFTASDNAVFEIDLAKLSSYEIALVMQALSTFPRPRSLESELSQSTLTLLSEYLKRNDLKMASFSQFKPWRVALQIALLEMSSFGYKTELGIDQYFQDKARVEGKPIYQLENFREQIALLASDSIELQDLSLRATIIESESVETMIRELVSAWQRGAADEMYNLSTQDKDKYPELSNQMERLLDKRNVKMAKTISQYLEQDGTYFVVVGALHMGGPMGLVKLLSKDYVVEQIYDTQ